MSEPQPSEGRIGDVAGVGKQETRDEKSDTAAADDSLQEDKPVKKVTLCGVCEKAPSKYKCSRCYLP
jgi:hypothetical protein